MKEVWSGLDVSKQWFDASWVSPDSSSDEFGSIPHQRFSRDPGGVRRFVSWLDSQPKHPTRVIMEVTGNYSLELFAWLVKQRPELRPAIINPKQAKHFHQSLGLRNRTDKVDCRSLGLMGRERRPNAYEPLPEPYKDIRDLMRQRRKLIDIRVAETQRLQESKTSGAALQRILKSHLRHIQKLLDRLDKALDKVLAASDRLRKDLALLQTIPGVARITSLTILGELGDLRRFNRSRQVSALSGMSPSRHQSGSSKNFTYIDRNGSPDLRRALYMSAVAGSTRKKQNSLARRYQRLLDKEKTKKQALVAVGRNILVIGRALLISEQPYRDDFQTPNLPRSCGKEAHLCLT